MLVETTDAVVPSAVERTIDVEIAPAHRVAEMTIVAEHEAAVAERACAKLVGQLVGLPGARG